MNNDFINHYHGVLTCTSCDQSEVTDSYHDEVNRAGNNLITHGTLHFCE